MKRPPHAALAGLLLSGLLTSGATAVIAAPAEDVAFANRAAQAGIAEVAAGQLAQAKATNESVKAFADKMVQDHSAANDELRDIATKASIVLPTDVSIEQKAAATRLSTFIGAEFDHAYVEQMVQDHDDAVDLFRNEVAGGKDDALRAYAKKTLPVLEMHRDMAKELQRANK